MLALVREHYPDFGPTFAAEKLAARHGLRLGVETLRQWMIADGLWIDRRHKPPSPHQPRRRRECLGELVQIDGSEHAWFEDRARYVHAAGVRGRCHQPVDATPVRYVGVGVRLFPRDPWLSGDPWQAGCLLQRQARHFPGEQQGRGRWRSALPSSAARYRS